MVFYHNLNPVLLNLGFIKIHWYGLMYVISFILVYLYVRAAVKHKKLKLSLADVDNLMILLTLALIIGARIFEVVFYQPSYYFNNPAEIIAVWKGGLSFHGGMVGIILASYLFCKKKKISLLHLADIFVVPLAFAQALGRIGNFINGELVGRVWDGKWCVVFPDFGDACRHPSTIYAALKRFVVFGWLLRLSFWMKFREGFIFWNFVFWEGAGRFFVDYFREDPIINGFSLGQWFSLAMVVVAGYMFWKYYQDDWKKILK